MVGKKKTKENNISWRVKIFGESDFDANNSFTHCLRLPCSIVDLHGCNKDHVAHRAESITIWLLTRKAKEARVFSESSWILAIYKDFSRAWLKKSILRVSIFVGTFSFNTPEGGSPWIICTESMQGPVKSLGHQKKKKKRTKCWKSWCQCWQSIPCLGEKSQAAFSSLLLTKLTHLVMIDHYVIF